jgi:hypothetical protein
MRLDTSGNLGLGVTPSAWSLGKAIEVGNLGNALWGIGSSNVALGANIYYASGALKYANTAAASYYQQSAGIHYWYNAVSGTAGNNITFTQAMTLDANSNLGIGTTPTNYSGYNTLVQNATTGSTFEQRVGTTLTGSLTSDTQVTLKANANIPLVFGTNNTERGRFTAGGSFLVGLTTGNEKFGVLAGASQNAASFTNPTATAATIFCWNQGTSGDNIFCEFATEAAYTARGSITYNRGAGQVAYNVTSDARLKDNIADAADAGSKVDALQVRQFDWKETGNHVDYGFVAQELHQVAPQAVSKPDDDEKMWSVDYSKLVPMLVKEIQSLRARVAQLESK